MTNVVVVDDHPLIREGLINILEEEPNLKVVGEAGNAPEAQRLLKKNAVDIAVLDISLPGKDGLELMKDIKLRYPHLSVLILSMHPEDRFAIRALKGGASGYVTKEMAPEELVKAINQILGGRKYISNNLAEKLAEIISIDSEKPPHESLSDREFQVFMLIASGKQIKEISHELTLSERTVYTYRARVLKKMKLNSNIDIIHYAIRYKLVD